MKVYRPFPAFLFLVCASAISAGLHAAQPVTKITQALNKVPLAFEINRGQADKSAQFLSRGSGYSLLVNPQETVLNLERQNALPKEQWPLSPTPSVAVDTIRMRLSGANPNAIGTAIDKQQGVVSYLLGSDPSKWHTGVPTYGRIQYADIYPGVNLVFYGNQRQLEYDFVVAPGADPTPIRWQINGARASIDADGNLVLDTANGPASFKKPVLYQTVGERRIPVDGSFTIAGDGVGFRIGKYDHSKPLIIDPVLAYASYLGGTSTDNIGNFIGPGHTSPTQGIAVDAQGSIYVTGYTYSTDFPTQNPYQSTPPAKMTGVSPGLWASAFVTKFSPDGSTLVYSTYLGGNGFDYGYAIAVDSNGSAYVAGSTTSPDFPVTTGAYQTVCSPIPDFYHGPNIGETSSCNSFYDASAFVTKLNANGTGIIYSTFLSGEGYSQAVAIALDPDGRAYIGGEVEGYCYDAPPSTPGPYPYTCFPTTPGAVINGTDTDGHSPQYGFVAVFDPTGAQLLYSSMFGDLNGIGPNANLGSGTTYASAVAVDPNGNFYLVGHTEAGALPTTNGVIQPTQGPVYNGRSLYAWRGFVAKFNPVTSNGGATLSYSTYLGAPALNSTSNISDFVSGVAADSDGNVYVDGYTQSPNYPVTAGAYQTTCGYGGGQPCATAYVTKLNSTGSAIVWATYVGNLNGASNDNVGTVGPMQVDGNGNVYLTGQAWFGFPVVNAVEPSAIGGSLPTFVAELDPNGQKLLFSTQINSEINLISQSTDSPAGVAVDTGGNIYVAGNTVGPGLLVTPGAFMTTENDFGGQCCALGNGFVAKIAPQGTATVALSALPSPIPAGQTVTLKATVTPIQQYASVPTGTIAFQDGSTALSTVPLDSTGKAAYSTSTLPAGDHTLTAVYSGDSTYPEESGSALLSITPTDTVPTIAPNPAAFGNQTMNTSMQIPVIITNTGANPLVISSVVPSSSSDFSQVNNCVTTLAPNASCTVTVAFYPTSASTESAMFSISDNAGVQTLQATGTGVSPVNSQIITFNALPDVTYGAGSIALTATASSTLPVSYSVSGPAVLNGSTLSITGTGQVTVTASQAGNSNWSAAPSVVRSFTVAPALLTVTATNATMAYSQAVPALTFTVSGFVNNDPSSVVSGAPAESTVATSASAPGGYPITVALGTLSAANYTFAFVNGTLTITTASQSITFAPLANVTYGVAPITLTATASSGLSVSYSVAGPATINGSILTVTGAGPVTVTASQAGNADYGAANSVQKSFTVLPATLNIKANNASMAYGQAVPSLTFTASGFVNNDAATVLSGAPQESTSATSTSAPGNYPITIGQGTLSAANYTLTFTNGTLSVTAASQTITFGSLASVVYGTSPITLAATASSKLPVSYSVTGPASVSGSVLTITGVGAVTVTASQAGNIDYSAATPVSRSFNVTAASQTITFNPIPAQVVGSISLTASASSGLPVNFTSLTAAVCSVSGTTANLLAPGTCTIQASQAGNANYLAATPVSQSFQVSSGAAAGFTITPNPRSEIIWHGDDAGFLLELRSINGFRGRVRLTCSGGPAGTRCVDFPQVVYLNKVAFAISRIDFPRKTHPGTYTITFTGTSGSMVTTATATFTVK